MRIRSWVLFNLVFGGFDFKVFGFLVLVLVLGFEQRVTALKRAYADIILNTAKEAAARIMVSERKAVGFQHELNVAKEQALQTLLRLKQMMDSKVLFSLLSLKWVWSCFHVLILWCLMFIMCVCICIVVMWVGFCSL